MVVISSEVPNFHPMSLLLTLFSDSVRKPFIALPQLGKNNFVTKSSYREFNLSLSTYGQVDLMHNQ